MIARRRLELKPTREAITDLAEIRRTHEAAGEGITRALQEIQAHPRSGELKTGRLEGARSWEFFQTMQDDEPAGRIVYVIQQHEIKIFAIHPDHDEAYKRARKRAAKYL